ncbi:MAG: hypothetical protein J0L66_08785 [Cytophagales bacterium]|nr:hypothetical protein [Cytophagales bacterium]
MKLLINVFLILLIFGVLTIVSQIGGLVFLLAIPIYRLIDRKTNGMWRRAVFKFFSFAMLYLMFVFIVVPLVARQFGRVPLPILETNYLKPATIWTVLLNRNYVKPQLKEIAYKVSIKLNATYPGAKVNYLEANFPFVDGFPLLPHLSHNDGKKLDLSFQYNSSITNKISYGVPSFTGYGVCEEPLANEQDMPGYCREKGFWQYNALRVLIPQGNKAKFTFDKGRTRTLVDLFAEHESIGKIFIEPHLQQRLGLTSSKIRFHGCHAVRHDDHLHVQLK